MEYFYIFLISISMLLLFPLVKIFSYGIFKFENKTTRIIAESLYIGALTGLIMGFFTISQNIFSENSDVFFMASLFFISSALIIMTLQRQKYQPFVIWLLITIAFYAYFRPGGDQLPDLTTFSYVTLPFFFLIIIVSLILLRDGIQKTLKNKTKYTNLIFSISSIILIFISFSLLNIVINLVYGDPEYYAFFKNPDYWILISISLAVVIVSNFLNTKIEKNYQETVNLSDFSLYSFGKYYRQPLVKEYMRKLNMTQEFEYAQVITFSIICNEELKKNLLEEIQEEFESLNKNILFFGTNLKNWALYIPYDGEINNLKVSIEGNNKLSRDENDMYKEIEELFKKTLNQKNHKVIFSASSSIYGIHSYDIDELIEKSEFVLMKNFQNQNEKNIISVYDHHQFIKNYELNTGIDLVSKLFSFKNLAIKFKRIKNDGEIFLLPSFEYKNISTGIRKITDDIKNIDSMRLTPTFKRMLAQEILREYNKNNYKEKLILTYDFSHINEKIEVKNLIKKIDNLKIEINSIIFNLDIKDNIENYFKSNPELKNWLNEMKIKYLISNVTENNNLESIIENVRPNYLLFNIKDFLNQHLLRLE